MTLLWGGETCIGGSHDTSTGLTEFGKQVVKRCFELGIVPDISHASINTAKSVADIADELGKPFIATHSNSRVVYDHERNLTPELFSRLVLSGGVVGISFCPKHICDETKEECKTRRPFSGCFLFGCGGCFGAVLFFLLIILPCIFFFGSSDFLSDFDSTSFKNTNDNVKNSIDQL